MLAIYWAESGSTLALEISVFHGLSDGKIGQAPGLPPVLELLVVVAPLPALLVVVPGPLVVLPAP